MKADRHRYNSGHHHVGPTTKPVRPHDLVSYNTAYRPVHPISGLIGSLVETSYIRDHRYATSFVCK